MIQSKKYFISKDDSFADVKKIIESCPEPALILHFSRGTHFLQVRADVFIELKEAADFYHKHLTIESLEPAVLSRAKEAGVLVNHPAGSAAPRLVYDVIPAHEGALSDELLVNDTGTRSDEARVPSESSFFDGWANKRSSVSRSGELSGRSGFSRLRIYVFLAAFSFFIFFGALFVYLYLPHARVVIELQPNEVVDRFSVLISGSADESALASADVVLRGEYVFATTSLPTSTLAFGRTDQKTTQKAEGRVLIRNTGVRSQFGIVARSRLIAPNSKVYYTMSPVTIPAYTDKGDAVVEVAIEAAEPGTAYNAEPSEKAWYFMGLRNTPQYNLVTAVLRYPIRGDSSTGSVSSDELSSAMQELLFSSLEAKGVFLKKEGWLLQPSALQLSSLSAHRGAKTVPVEVRALMFEESKLKESLATELIAKRSDGGESYEVKSLDLQYEEGRFDSEKKTLSVTVNARAILAPRISSSEIFQLIRGRGESDFRASLVSVPAIANASVSLWPEWFTKIPDSISKVTIQFR